MRLKLPIQIALIALSIACTLHCDLVKQLMPIGMQQTFGSDIASLDWCNGCNLLAASSFSTSSACAVFDIYQFNAATETLSMVISPTEFGITLCFVKWCPTCNFLAAGSDDVNGNGIIQLYSFDPSIPGNLERVGTTTILGEAIGSNKYLVQTLDWCPSCSFFAASSSVNNTFVIPSLIQVYSFDQLSGNLTRAGNTFFAPTDDIQSIKWCSNCMYLAVAGDSYIAILGFDPNNPELGLTKLYSLTPPTYYYSVDWCGNCGYLAAGGQDFSSPLMPGIIDIYYFDQTSPSLTLIKHEQVSPTTASVSDVKWCQGCNNLAAGELVYDPTQKFTRDILKINHLEASMPNPTIGVLQLYHFEQSPIDLSLQQTITVTSWAIVAKVPWCGNCDYLAAGGADPSYTYGYIQLYKSEFIMSPIVQAQKIYHRFPTQVDIINQLCWNEVPGAIAYIVYADEALTIQLAIITNPPLCYWQHQIRSGALTTYYVTAVDADGNQSAPAVVTI